MNPTSPIDGTQPSETDDNLLESSPYYENHVLGVWRLVILKDTRWKLPVINFGWKNVSSTLPLLRRALSDVYAISPSLFARRILAELWFAVQGPLSLYVTNRLFCLIEASISGSSTQVQYDLGKTVFLSVACSAFSAYMGARSWRDKHAFATRIRYAYEARIFQVQLTSDLGNAIPDAVPDRITDCLEDAISITRRAISLPLHVHFFVRALGSGLRYGGPMFLVLCTLPTLVTHLFTSSYEVWSKAYFVDAINRFYLRKLALQKFTSNELRQELVAGGIVTYLTHEYRKVQDGLGDTPDTAAELLYSQQNATLENTLMKLSADAPTLFFALLTLIKPSNLSMAQLAVLNQNLDHLTYSLRRLTEDIESCPKIYSRIRSVYAVIDATNKMKDGDTPFPRPGYEDSPGMSIEFRDVSFAYPNSNAHRDSLSHISFTIQPGQLVVIVGTNGSGKSTTIKLLSRLYDITSGSILIDGIPIGEYKISELRKGIAMLTQEHKLYPLSLGESIKLGAADPEAVSDGQGTIEDAVAAAGAQAIVENFPNGYDRVLEPISLGYISHEANGIEAFEEMEANLEQPVDISGGEKQKLVAARTFMRLFTSRIRLVTVDEPSSALDPAAEYHLFSNLRRERQGRTMIMVTHRFGHLTKHADLIICMKGGVLVEMGTHADLLSRGGEYAHLYNVQAEAFEST